MADINGILEKIRKLRALAGNNTNEAEVKAALAAADKLIQNHRVSEAELELLNAAPPSNDPLVRKPIPTDSKNRSSWREAILSALCNSYGACWYYCSVGDVEYTVVARQSDHEIISYMYEYLCAECLRLAKRDNPITALSKGTDPLAILAAIQAGGARENKRSAAISWAKSYQEGFGQGISAQFDSIRKAQLTAATQSAAMVLLDNRKGEAKKFLQSQVKLRGGSSLGGSHSDAGARSAGYSAGLRTNVSKGLSGGGGSRGSLT